MDQLEHSLLLCWFVNVEIDDCGMEPRGVQQELQPVAESGDGTVVFSLGEVTTVTVNPIRGLLGPFGCQSF